jgi:hypothetical protein
MTTADAAFITDQILARVRKLLKQQPAFAGVSRDDFDNVILADLESDLHHIIGDLIDDCIAEARAEAEADKEFEAWAAKQAKRDAARAKRRPKIAS